MNEYPYFIYPLLRQLRETTDRAERKALEMRIAVNVGQREALARLIGELPAETADFYCETVAAKKTTDDTIDSFIEKFGGGQQAITPTYFRDNTPKPDSEKPKPALKKPETAPEKPTPTPEKAKKAPEKAKTYAQEMQEVKLMVKNHDYERAIQRLTEINLNNPKKSIYFADQIRFIRKMMDNERKKN